MIRIRNVSKVFGRVEILSDINATFQTGGIHGLIGYNGSGKTVLLKCISGLVSVTSGTIQIDDQILGKDIEMPPSLGSIIETPGFLPSHSGYDNLKYLAKIRKQIGKNEICYAMERVGLDPKDKKWVSHYSLGMRQRLGIAQAIMEDPDLLILDEPMNGLDNDCVRNMRKLFLNLADEGKTILLASHNPIDIDHLCDSIWKMDRGHLTKL